MNGHFFDRLSHNPQALEYFNKGVARQQENNFAKAVDCYREAIRLEPELEEAHYNMGVAYDSMERFADALRCFQEALRLNPLTIKAHFQIGIIYGKQGKYDEAIRCFQEALRFNPHYAEAYYNMAYAYVMKDDREKSTRYAQETIRYASEAVRLKPNYFKAHCLIGGTLAKLGQHAAALRAYQKSLRQLPKDMHKNASKDTAPDPDEFGHALFTYTQMGDAYMALNRPADAVRCYEEVIRLLREYTPDIDLTLIKQRLARAQAAAQANPSPKS